MLPFSFNHSACKLSLLIHESPVCLLWDIFFSLFFPSPLPVSLLSQQKSIPAHSLCQHLPSYPLLPPSFSSHWTYCTAHIQFFCLSQLCIGYFIALHWTVRIICWISWVLALLESFLLPFYEVMLTFKHWSWAHTLVVLFAQSGPRCYYECATAS